MPLFTARSAAVYGIDAHIIEVEVDFSNVKLNEEQFHTVGLPDAAVRESRDRVRSALKNTGFHFPAKKITVNLAPAGIKKEGLAPKLDLISLMLALFCGTAALPHILIRYYTVKNQAAARKSKGRTTARHAQRTTRQAEAAES